MKRKNEAYGDEDLEEMGGKGGIDAKKLQRKVDELNEHLKQQPENKKLKKAVKTLEKKHLPRLEKYEAQEKTLAGRNSYSKTDPDATCFRMKEDRAARKALAASSLQRADRDRRAVHRRLQHPPTSRGPGLFYPAYGTAKAARRGEDPKRSARTQPMAVKRIMLLSKKRSSATT